MSLIMDKQEKVFDCTAIKRGDLISAQHSCWKEPKSGIVSAVTPEEIKILYQPAIANVTSFLTILADDVATGQWKSAGLKIWKALKNMIRRKRR